MEKEETNRGKLKECLGLFEKNEKEGRRKRKEKRKNLSLFFFFCLLFSSVEGEIREERRGRGRILLLH